MSRLADRIRQADDKIREVVDVPEWGVKIEVQSMTALQRATMQSEWNVEEDQAANKLYSLVLLYCCFDPDTDEPVFEESDLEWLLEEKSAQVVDKVAQKCLKVSGLAGDSVDELGKDSSDLMEETQS